MQQIRDACAFQVVASRLLPRSRYLLLLLLWKVGSCSPAVHAKARDSLKSIPILHLAEEHRTATVIYSKHSADLSSLAFCVHGNAVATVSLFWVLHVRRYALKNVQ